MISVDVSQEVRLAVRAEVRAAIPELVDAVRRAVADRLVGVAEAAGILGVSVGALRARIARGQVPCVRHGRSIRLRLSDLTGTAGPIGSD